MKTEDERFVVTLRMDERSFATLNSLRQRYFPPARNFLSAHLTLFHALTVEHCERVRAAAVALPTSQISLEFVRPASIGAGVIITVASEGLTSLHSTLKQTLGSGLTAQDQQRPRPHVTVQNKVTAALAKATLAEVEAGFTPWWGHGLGLEIWRFLGGPWAPYAYYPFA
jgi:2'-5' RNA ligase